MANSLVLLLVPLVLITVRLKHGLVLAMVVRWLKTVLNLPRNRRALKSADDRLVPAVVRPPGPPVRRVVVVVLALLVLPGLRVNRVVNRPSNVLLLVMRDSFELCSTLAHQHRV